MTVKIEKLPDEPILSLVYDGRMTPEDLRYTEQESVKLAAGLEKPVYRVSDARALKMSFSDLVILMFDAARARNQPGSLADPDFVDLIIAPSEGLVAFGTKSLSQEQYGKLNIQVFDTVATAFAHAREEIAKRGA
ncbi:MAG: hypothetical protein JXA10_05415 [Anaerolineae bacterium]|nr:hypothetical protein [Anaerolineae bacterium]